MLLTLILFIGIIVINGTLTDYKPNLKEKLEVKGKGYFNTSSDSVVTILSWNIGYCGLGKDVDFFYDGGKMSRPSKEYFQKYINGVLNFLAKNDTIDMILLQQVGTNAKRSYYTNEAKLINQFLPNYYSVFAKNYDVSFIPFPWNAALGSVISGMITLSKIKPFESYRYNYCSNYQWPKKIFFHDRCMIYTKFKMLDGKYLIVLNTHNSSYADAAELREIESYVMKAIMLDEYGKGNYVVAAGDWNRNPPNFDYTKIITAENKRNANPPLDIDFLPPQWQIVYDHSIPTYRDLNEPYQKGVTKTTITDYFAVSPNLEVIENKTIPTNFEFSNHQPVFLRVKPKTDTIK